MLIAGFVVGPVSTNCYIVACNVDSEAIVIDPDLRGEDEMEAVLRQIGEEKLAELPDDVAVYPGHGEPTTIGEEKSPRSGLGDWFD